MKQSSVIFTLFVLLLAAVSFAHPQPTYATCAPNPYHGVWVNEKSKAELVTAVAIHTCYDSNDTPRHPMFWIEARCSSGQCSWGWSPGRSEGQGYADTRFWRNATTSQTFVRGENNRLKVVSTVSFNDGSTRVFTDVMRLHTLSVNETNESRTVSAQFRVTKATPDGSVSAGGGDNEFRPRISFTRGGGQSGGGWDLAQPIPLKFGSVDVIFRLKEEDDWFNGGDDHFDINPDPNEKDIRVRVYLEAGIIFLIQNDQEVQQLGKVGQTITLAGQHGEDRATVELVLQSSHVKPVLSLP